ncbi:hypothetical protein ACFSZS_00065 [Seohaeicola zhoushanensis]
MGGPWSSQRQPEDQRHQQHHHREDGAADAAGARAGLAGEGRGVVALAEAILPAVQSVGTWW